MRIYMGWDPRDAYAYRVASWSIQKHASIPIDIIPLIDRDLRNRKIYWRSYRVDQKGQMWDDFDDRPFSTQFSFTRFAPPIIEQDDDEWSLFVDPDVLFRTDVAELLQLADNRKSVMCVQHNHHPREDTKMDGVLQTKYERKNWSSLYMFRGNRCPQMTKYNLNNMAGKWLHGFRWVEDDEIGELPVSWNWLEGSSDPAIEPDMVHFTRGTPDFHGYENAAYADEWRAVYREAVGDSQFVPFAATHA